MTKNITLRMDEQLLKDVKHIAVEKDMSVSAWISQVVEQAAKRDFRYETAATEIMRMMEEAQDYGDGGKIYTRDEMHER
ncbi:MAG: CopG family transcriptional regulator [Verrucomicrobia bacterium]|nr:CopG family transcriptional regulator [Verrucomicrobiota bacterium]